MAAEAKARIAAEVKRILAVVSGGFRFVESDCDDGREV